MRATYLFLLLAYVVIEDANGRHSFDLVEEADQWRVDDDILYDLDTPSRHGGGDGGFGDRWPNQRGVWPGSSPRRRSWWRS